MSRLSAVIAIAGVLLFGGAAILSLLLAMFSRKRRRAYLVTSGFCSLLCVGAFAFGTFTGTKWVVHRLVSESAPPTPADLARWYRAVAGSVLPEGATVNAGASRPTLLPPTDVYYLRGFFPKESVPLSPKNFSPITAQQAENSDLYSADSVLVWATQDLAQKRILEGEIVISDGLRYRCVLAMNDETGEFFLVAEQAWN